MRLREFAARLVAGGGALLRGRSSYSFYFTTIRPADALAAIGLAFASAVRGRAFSRSRDALAEAAKMRFGGEAFFYGSARSALYDYLRGLELPDQSEVVVTGFTCEVVANAVVQAGLRPVYADIDPETLGTDPTSVLRVLSDRTGAIIVQHTFGNPADLQDLLRLARDRGLPVIEDCAVALGSAHEGRPLGTFGDAAIVSFELSKTITSCRGGMLVVQGPEDTVARHRKRYEAVPEPSRRHAAAVLLQLGLSGFLYRPRLYPLGRPVADALFRLGVFRPSTLPVELRAGRPEAYLVRLSGGQARILLRQWRRLPGLVEHTRALSARYEAALSACSGVRIVAPGPEACLVRFPLMTPSRERLSQRFEEEGIELGLWFTAPLSSPSVDHAAFGYRAGDCPQAERVAALICNLPAHPRITPAVAEKVIELVRRVHAEVPHGDA